MTNARLTRALLHRHLRVRIKREDTQTWRGWLTESAWGVLYAFVAYGALNLLHAWGTR